MMIQLLPYLHGYNVTFSPRFVPPKCAPPLYSGSNTEGAFFLAFVWSHTMSIPGRRCVLLCLEREPQTRCPTLGFLPPPRAAAASPDNAIGFAGSSHMIRWPSPEVSAIVRMARHWLLIVLCFFHTCLRLLSCCSYELLFEEPRNSRAVQHL